MSGPLERERELEKKNVMNYKAPTLTQNLPRTKKFHPVIMPISPKAAAESAPPYHRQGEWCNGSGVRCNRKMQGNEKEIGARKSEEMFFRGRN